MGTQRLYINKRNAVANVFHTQNTFNSTKQALISDQSSYPHLAYAWLGSATMPPAQARQLFKAANIATSTTVDDPRILRETKHRTKNSRGNLIQTK